MHQSLKDLRHDDEFVHRHIAALNDNNNSSDEGSGEGSAEVAQMLADLGLDSLDALIDTAVPASIRMKKPLALDDPLPEHAALARLQSIMKNDRPGRSFIGLGYYPTYTPPVIQRNVLENPGWYTAYTPYQPEISQGRLECLLAFQHMVMDLTGMDLANASLLDEATAAAEAMALAKRVCKNKNANAFFVDSECFPQTIDVLKTRAGQFGFDLIIGSDGDLQKQMQQQPADSLFGALFQYPGRSGQVTDLAQAAKHLHDKNPQSIVVVAADLLSLTLLKPPGEMGADVVIGSSQRFGVPMGYGGPHAAFFATRDAYKRAVPGRIIGVSVDTRGRPALRMALQTREQHIRREKANSNICTAQVLLANMAALYAMYHGPKGLQRIARRVHRLTALLNLGLTLQPNGEWREGHEQLVCNHGNFFDTLTLHIADQGRMQGILSRAEEADFHLRQEQTAMAAMLKAAESSQPQFLSISLDECTTADEVERLLWVILGDPTESATRLSVADMEQAIAGTCSQSARGDKNPSAKATQLIRDFISSTALQTMQRSQPILQHPMFNSYHSETEMLRYLKRLENRDISLTHSMIPLGSCTMKLNAASEMMPVTWPAFAAPHPFTPPARTPGYRQMISELETMLKQITGFDAISMQPNSGAQGEYAGLLAIRKYLDRQGQQQRNVCLIPTSAHGTNPASAQMIGMKVQLVACDAEGNIDLADLRAKAKDHKDTLAALMVTYPSTHGVFEEAIRKICDTVHKHGGQVYMDGANLNAMVGLSQPADIGADVAHVNLHKTFCIPHGGGGPGMGPIGVKAHLAPHLANHSLISLDYKGKGPEPGNSAVSAAPWGSAGILPISWMYITMMGGSGLTKATQVAILNANYIAKKLAGHYPVLYTGRSGMVAHECIIDLRPLKQASGISEEDVAKRLMDFGFHAPTMSFPVAGTLMIEPTESESKQELDKFIHAMLVIREEIAAVESGQMDAENNPLKRAPHTLADISDADWARPYSRRTAVFPGRESQDGSAPETAEDKYWPPVNRVDNVYGDRNLVCSCPPPEAYQ